MPNNKIKPVLDFAMYIIDRPSRWISALIVVVVVAVVAFAYSNGATIYSDIAKIVGEKNFIAKLDQNKFATEIPKLVKNSKAVSGTVWVVDLAADTRKIVYSYHAVTDTRERASYFGYVASFYSDNDIINQKLIRLQRWDNEVICYELPVETEFSDLLKKEGVHWVCAISVPPESGQFIGLVTLEFAVEPVQTALFNRRLISAANNITKYGTGRGRPNPAVLGTDN